MTETPSSPASRRSSSRRAGLVVAGPAEYLVHQRMGRLRHLGRGAAAWVVPGLDRAYLIPLSARTVSFEAEQITLENQGVAIAGFAIWSVSDPEIAGTSIDFADPDHAIDLLGERLREVVEAAIRREVANQTLDDVLRKRAAITGLLTDELLSVASEWGLRIVTAEVKSVTILSRQLFENMQAEFRNEQRLASSRSALEADAAIAEAEAEAQEEEARRAFELRLASIEREETAGREEIARDRRLEREREEQELAGTVARLGDELSLVRAREEHRRRALPVEEALLELEERLRALRREDELRAEEHRERLAAVADAIERRRIETENGKDRMRLLVEALPEIAHGLEAGTVNIGDPAVAALTRDFLHRLSGEGSADAGED